VIIRTETTEETTERSGIRATKRLRSDPDDRNNQLRR